MLSNRELRKLIDDVIPTASELDAFLIDYMPDIYKVTPANEDRTAKTNRLLSTKSKDEIVSALRSFDPFKLQKIASQNGILIAGKNIQNPFKKYGTLPAGSITYVKRNCDDKLLANLTPHSRVVVYGETQIGKSSLLRNIQNFITALQIICYIDFEDFSTHDATHFHQQFFARLGDQIDGTLGIKDWPQLSSIGSQQLIIMIDEFSMLRTQEIINQFLPRLLKFISNYHATLVIAMPITMDEYLLTHNLNNPKYREDWININVPLFTQVDTHQIISLLPKRSRDKASQQMSNIMKLSRCKPQALQKLCHLLYDAEARNASDQELEALIFDKRAY